ncbi:MAG: family 43 glycosylhydrolase, partial [Bacteroidales bacterium]|nr:family 43 glycosylhydrolase [Bacteroidales bacterium]
NDVITASSLGWSYWVGRLGVAYVPAAKKYALVMQYNSSVLISVCDSPTGTFKWHNNIDMTSIIGTSNTGDQTVFTDDNGKSYLVYSYGSGRSRIYLSEIGVKDGKVTLLDCQQVYKGSGREGNCMFKYKGKYYICASDLYGWNASNVYYLQADSIYGPYTPTNNMLKMPGADKDYGHVTQTGFFYTVKGSKQETVIYCGDRWADFAGNGNGYNQWCPLSFVNNAPYFNSLSQWSINAVTGEWTVGKDNNYVKNGSFDADRVYIPSGNKPVQTYLTGWTFQVIKGNTIAVGSANSPVLNANNSSTDRAIVIGNKCLNIHDSIDYARKISQIITSTTYVPLTDGLYTMTAKVKSGSSLKQLYMYAKSNNETFKTDMPYSDNQWHNVVINNIQVKNGNVEVGFMAEGAAKTGCRIDDVSLVKTGELTALKTIRTSGEQASSNDYYTLNGMKIAGPQKGWNIVRKTVNGHTETSKLFIQ